MARWTLGFLIGVLCCAQFTSLPSLSIIFFSILFVIPFFCIVYCYYPVAITFFLGILCGGLWALFFAQLQLSHKLPDALEGKPLEVTGKIISIPEYQTHQLRFDFLIQNAKTTTPIKYPIRVRLRVYHIQQTSPLFHSEKGQVWKLMVKLKKPRGFWNVGSFDVQAHYFQINIQALGYVIHPNTAQLIEPADFLQQMDRLRAHIAHSISQILAHAPLRGLINALTNGMRYEITPTQWQVMRNTGTNHLFAISGLHLAFIANLFYFITRIIWCRIPCAALIFPASGVAALLTGVFALFYAALAGFALPIQRAFIMLIVFLAANLSRRHLTSGYAFFSALFIVLVYSPFAVLSASFWLSFGAVGFILYSIVERHQAAKNWQIWIRVQVSIGLGLIPFSLLFFQQVSWISFVANAVAIPVTGFVILPLALLGALLSQCFTSLGSGLLLIAEKFLEWLWQFLELLAQFNGLQYNTAIITSWILFASLIGLILLLAPSGIPHRYLSTFYFLPLFFYQIEAPKSGNIRLHLLDVGQGLATVLQTQHHTLIYDTGPHRFYDAGKDILVPFLRQQSIKKIDTLIISHADNDHIGGAATLLQNIPAQKIYTSFPKKMLPYSAQFCQQGMRWQWDKVNFEILYPPSNSIYLGNDSSCVLKVTNAQHSILFTGDIERMAEHYLVEKEKNTLQSTILIVPHHGSKTSSSIPFLNSVQPQIALFPTGYHNQFKFPHPIVLQRYRRLHAQMYDTAKDGAVTLFLSTNSSSIKVTTFRNQHRHFWQVEAKE